MSAAKEGEPSTIEWLLLADFNVCPLRSRSLRKFDRILLVAHPCRSKWSYQRFPEKLAYSVSMLPLADGFGRTRGLIPEHRRPMQKTTPNHAAATSVALLLLLPPLLLLILLLLSLVRRLICCTAPGCLAEPQWNLGFVKGFLTCIWSFRITRSPSIVTLGFAVCQPSSSFAAGGLSPDILPGRRVCQPRSRLGVFGFAYQPPFGVERVPPMIRVSHDIKSRSEPEC